MVEDENDDVDEQLVNAVWVVIFVCMVKVFGDPCRVWSKSDVEEEENEVDPYGEGSVVGDEVVWMVDGSVIFESWIVVGVMAMSMDVDDEEQERLGSRH